MTKRVSCFLLAMALLTCCALASGAETTPEPAKHSIITSCDSRFGSVKLDSGFGLAEDNIYFKVTANAGCVPENPKISTASGLRGRRLRFLLYHAGRGRQDRRQLRLRRRAL